LSAISRTLASLHYRDFRLVWQGSVSEHLGEWMEIVAFMWLARQITPSPFLVSFIGFSRYIAMAVFPIPGGVVADRMDRRRLLIIALLVACAISLSLSFLVYTGKITLWHMVSLGLLTGVATSFNHPARASMIPNLVRREDLLNAVSLDLLSVMGAAVIGAPLGGYLIDLIGIAPIFLFRVAGALLAIVWLLRVVTPLDTGVRQHPWHSLKEGARFVAGHPAVRWLVLLYLLPMFSYFAYFNLLPVFAVDILHVTGSGYGLLTMAAGIGAVVMLLIAASLGDFPYKGWLLVFLGILMGLGMAGFGASSWLLLCLPLIALVNGTRLGFLSINATIIQATIPDEVRGRVMSLREVAMGLGPLGGLMAGALAEYTGVALAIVLWGLGVALLASGLLLSPQIRSMR